MLLRNLALLLSFIPCIAMGQSISVNGVPNQSIGSVSPTLAVNSVGGIGDGASHQACTYLGLANLTALQAYNGGIYSFATACTNQMDWLAAQYAVNKLTSTGGAVSLSKGTYTWDQPVVLPNSQDSASGAATAVYLVGQGEGATVVIPSVADFGANTAMISCGAPAASWTDNSGAGSGRYGSVGACYGGIEDITFNNPFATGTTNVSSTTYLRGQINFPAPSSAGTPIQMDGVVVGGRMYLHRVGAWGFRTGFNVVGDHMTWDQLDAEQDACGIYFAPPSIYLVGDIIMTGHNFIGGSNKLAGFCVDKDATMQGFYQTGELYLGYEPYGFLKFPGVSDAFYGGTYTGFMQNVRMDVLQDEQQGNAAIWDDNIAVTTGAISSNPQTTLGAVQINSIFATWGSGSGQKLTSGGRGTYAWIGANTYNGFRIVNISGGANNFFTASGQIAGIIAWNAGSSDGGIDITGDLPSILGQYTSIEFVGQANSGSAVCEFVHLHYLGTWDGGEIAIYPAATEPVPGTLLQVFNYQAATVSSGSAPILGVAMQYLTTNTAGGQCVAYANTGYATVLNTSSPTTGSLMVVSGTAGKGVQASGTAAYVVGIVQNGGSTSSNVKLNVGTGKSTN